MRLPLIAAPMLGISGVDLVSAACRHGVVGAFPTANARSTEELDRWLQRIKVLLAECPVPPAPWCANLIMRQPRLEKDLACLVRHQVEVVITSVGSPAPVIPVLHDIGCLVLADVNSLAHAHKAADAGADGLVLLSAGAGGQTGRLNPFAFVRAVRRFFDGPVVLAGGMADGAALWAARVLGCDLGYMGTRFIAASESMASPAYRQMLVESTIDDVLLTRAFTGLDTNMLQPSIIAAGLDPSRLDEQVSAATAGEMYGSAQKRTGPRRWTDIWSAGHSVSGVQAIEPVAALIDRTLSEYREARLATSRLAAVDETATGDAHFPVGLGSTKARPARVPVSPISPFSRQITRTGQGR